MERIHRCGPPHFYLPSVPTRGISNTPGPDTGVYNDAPTGVAGLTGAEMRPTTCPQRGEAPGAHTDRAETCGRAEARRAVRDTPALIAHTRFLSLSLSLSLSIYLSIYIYISLPLQPSSLTARPDPPRPPGGPPQRCVAGRPRPRLGRARPRRPQAPTRLAQAGREETGAIQAGVVGAGEEAGAITKGPQAQALPGDGGQAAEGTVGQD